MCPVVLAQAGTHLFLYPAQVSIPLDQAGAAFGSAAVPRPVGSSLMPLRRTPRRPDLVR